ncbi:hypothetical protein Pan241w_00640 [Gimesia alba]|uniref:Uncharacterized protein n=1 Tax=Gimesia alba TaxID=2527973 RepID=A0A517R856_9PLAN|nr:hypothetical protein [Gimesia alba]QDT40011.1 hypothetical protein Pan241w_00640 [Gimesia alba]
MAAQDFLVNSLWKKCLAVVAGVVIFAGPFTIVSGRDAYAGTPNVKTIIRAWEAAANSVRSLHIRMEGIDSQRTLELEGRVSVAGSQQMIDMPREIEYWLHANDNRERYHKIYIGPSSDGLIPLEFTVVNTKREQRELNPGGVGLNPYDELKINPPAGVQDYEVNALRILLNRSVSGQSYFSQSKFVLLKETTQEINGVRHRALECSEKRGIRIWFQAAAPFRISRVELGLSDRKRYGHTEYRYEYQDASQQATGSPFPTLKAIEVSGYDPTGKLHQHLRSTVTKWNVNPEISEKQFQIAPGTGAIIADYTATPAKHFIRLADGTHRRLERHELRRDAFLKLSAEVKRSPIKAENPVEKEKFPPPAVSSSYWKYIVLVMSLLLCLFLFWRRRGANRCQH